jgi:putative redox protein
MAGALYHVIYSRLNLEDFLMTEENPENRWKEISAEWDGSGGYTAVSKSGASVLMGTGRDGQPGMGPMEMLLAGLAGCTMMDIIEILKKKRQIPVEFRTVVRGSQRITEYPYRFTEFQVEYVLWGENLESKDVEQAIKLSEEKYCSVGGTLVKAGPIHSTYRIMKPGEAN